MGTLQTVYFLFMLLPKKPHQKIHFRRSVYYFLQVNLSFTIRLHGRPADPGGQVRQGLGGHLEAGFSTDTHWVALVGMAFFPLFKEPAQTESVRIVFLLRGTQKGKSSSNSFKLIREFNGSNTQAFPAHWIQVFTRPRRRHFSFHWHL